MTQTPPIPVSSQLSEQELRNYFYTATLGPTQVQSLMDHGFKFRNLGPDDVLRVLNSKASYTGLKLMLEEGLDIKCTVNWDGNIRFSQNQSLKSPLNWWYPPYKNPEQKKDAYRFIRLLESHGFPVDFSVGNQSARCRALKKAFHMDARLQINQVLARVPKKSPRLDQVIEFFSDFNIPMYQPKEGLLLMEELMGTTVGKVEFISLALVYSMVQRNIDCLSDKNSSEIPVWRMMTAWMEGFDLKLMTQFRSNNEKTKEYLTHLQAWCEQTKFKELLPEKKLDLDNKPLSPRARL